MTHGGNTDGIVPRTPPTPVESMPKLRNHHKWWPSPCTHSGTAPGMTGRLLQGNVLGLERSLTGFPNRLKGP